MESTRRDWRKCPIAVIGSGSIGTAFAIVFADAGYEVRLQDPDPASLTEARGRIATALDQLSRYELLQGPAERIAARIHYVDDVAEALAGVQHVQECAPEKLELKRALFSQIEALAPADAVIASSASAIPASQSTAHLSTRQRCLVCHPANPPFLIRVVEIVPAPFTAPEAVERAGALMAGSGMTPVIVRKEIEGFVFNRLQGAVLREAYCLFRDGVASLDDIDRLMRDGLGMRWSFMGPFETADLNTRGGLAAHAVKMGPAYERMGRERGQHDPWTPDLVARAAAERRAILPLEDWQRRTEWRDRRLMALLKHRRSLEADETSEGAAMGTGR